MAFAVTEKERKMKMFVSKRKYEELENKLCDVEYKLLVSESKRKEVEEMLKKYKANEHECNAMCEGCQNLIEGKELKELYDPAGFYGRMCSTERTTRRCALDRTCKDFKEKE